MVWAQNDMKLVTCGKDGAIYEFNTRTGERDMDIVHSKTIYMDLAISNDTNQIFPAAQDGRFKEINNQSVNFFMPNYKTTPNYCKMYRYLSKIWKH